MKLSKTAIFVGINLLIHKTLSHPLFSRTAYQPLFSALMWRVHQGSWQSFFFCSDGEMAAQDEARWWGHTRTYLDIQITIGVPAATLSVAEARFVDDCGRRRDLLLVLFHPLRDDAADYPTIGHFIANRNLL